VLFSLETLQFSNYFETSAHKTYLQHSYAEVLPLVDEYLAMHPKDILALNEKGCSLIYSGKIEESISILLRTLEINPNFATGYNNIGWGYNNLHLYKFINWPMLI
jgi:tetratricopeptide (TPR) repeat protein